MVLLNCKRCKKQFKPKKKELRCLLCLKRRKGDRDTRRRVANEDRETTKAIERIMKGNGSRKGKSNATLLF